MTNHSMEGLPRRAADYEPGEMAALLRVGAELDGRPGVAAAVHLLLWTDLPGRRDFAKYVGVHGAVKGSERAVVGAWVDWEGLHADRLLAVTESVRGLVDIAASLGAGCGVDLSASTRGVRVEDAGRVAEAVLIGAGAAGLYEVRESCSAF